MCLCCVGHDTYLTPWTRLMQGVFVLHCCQLKCVFLFEYYVDLLPDAKHYFVCCCWDCEIVHLI